MRNVFGMRIVACAIGVIRSDLVCADVCVCDSGLLGPYSVA